MLTLKSLVPSALILALSGVAAQLCPPGSSADASGTQCCPSVPTNIAANCLAYPSDSSAPVLCTYDPATTTTFTVPIGVTTLFSVLLQGGGGGNFPYYSNPSLGGLGGEVSGFSLDVTAASTLYVVVGGRGGDGVERGVTNPGGYNGGGMTSALVTVPGGSGGGASDIRYMDPAVVPLATFDSRLAVAGGGGGAGLVSSTTRISGDESGDAGASTGSSGSDSNGVYAGRNGQGGTQTTGGAGGTDGPNIAASGSIGQGGAGMTFGTGAGGGGLYGGGGAEDGAGGGGGSSIVPAGGSFTTTTNDPIIEFEYYPVCVPLVAPSGSRRRRSMPHVQLQPLCPDFLKACYFPSGGYECVFEFEECL